MNSYSFCCPVLEIMAVLQRISYQDVTGIRVGRFGPRVNTSCIVYRIGDVLIDTGPPNQWRPVSGFAAEQPITRILLTHHHEDHSGNAARLAKKLGAKVWAPEKTVSLLRNGFALRAYQKVVWGRPRRFEADMVPETIDIEGGFKLKTCPTPGHAVDLTCYLESERGWLFSSDLFVAKRPRYLRLDEKPHREIESISQMLTLDFDTLFCAHRGVVLDGKSALKEKRDYLVELRDNIADLRQKGMAAEAIARSLLGKEDITARITGGHYAKRNYVGAFLGSAVDNEPISSPE